MDFLIKTTVNNAKENILAQRAFFRLGIFWDGMHDNILTFLKSDYPITLYNTQARSLKWSTVDFKQLTVDELSNLQNKEA